TNFAIDYIFTEEKYYDNPFYGDGQDVRGDVDDINNRNFTYVWRNILNYIWTANEDNIFNFKAVAESQRNYSNYLESYGEGIAAGGLYNLNTVATPQFVGSTTTDWAVQSFTGLVNYGYKDKAFVDASIRYEGNSRFSDSKRWGTFWSVGLGYLLSEEDIFQDLSWLDLLKVRASYGKTGNASIGLNQYQALVGFGSYNDQPNIQPDQLGNRNLTWEKASSFDVALEFGVFNKLDGSVTFFRKNSNELLFDVPLSYSTGHASQLQNSGKLYNQGLEVELNADIIRNNNFALSLGGNFTTLKNEVTELPTDLNGNPIEITTSTRYRAVEGYPVDAWYMKEWAGVDPDNGDPLWYMDTGSGNRTTTNNYNLADSYYQGANAQPKTYGGLNTRIDIYNFYVSANLYYAFGFKVYDNWAYYQSSDGQFNLFFGQYETQAPDTHWQEPGDVAKNPKIIYGGNKLSNRNSSRFLYRGDYLRLRTLNVGYRIPSKYLENIGLQSATLYFLGQNLWTHAFDKDLKYDPEVKASGFTDLQAAPLRSVTFGVKVNF
ncbi:MAG: TonB-dependent receptor, partial [Balneolaceae bacterium]